MTTRVEVAWPSLTRAWRKMGYQELWWQFQPDAESGWHDPGDAALEATVQQAVMSANQDVEDAGWGPDVFTESVSTSEKGPVALMSRAGPKDGVRAWFDAFARHLEDAGLAGKVTAAPQAFFPRWMNSTELPGVLTAFVAYHTDDLAPLSHDQRRSTWHVPADLTERIAAAAVEWGRFDGADVYLSRSVHTMRGTDPDVATPLAEGIARYAQAGVTYLRSARPRRLVSANYSPLGQACYGDLDESTGWEQRLQHVLDAMLTLPAATNLAFLRYSVRYSTTWSAIGSHGPKVPYVPRWMVTANGHLYQRHTPDAHGIQILTDQHLANAHDLSDWIIEPLASGRHLVRAADLAAWYAQPDVDPDTLARARADFGAMILTPETIAANPPPPLPTDG